MTPYPPQSMTPFMNGPLDYNFFNGTTARFFFFILYYYKLQFYSYSIVIIGLFTYDLHSILSLSFMTAWQEIQLDWAMNTEQDLVTGVLLWDLSAAFDTLDCEGLCNKKNVCE